MSHHRPAVEVAKSAECQITLLPLPSAVADRTFSSSSPKGFYQVFVRIFALETPDTIEIRVESAK